jgi:hypothetical protein
MAILKLLPSTFVPAAALSVPAAVLAADEVAAAAELSAAADAVVAAFSDGCAPHAASGNASVALSANAKTFFAFITYNLPFFPVRPEAISCRMLIDKDLCPLHLPILAFMS